MPTLPGRSGSEHSTLREKYLATLPDEITIGAVPIEQPAAAAVARAEARSEAPAGTPVEEPVVEAAAEPEDPPEPEPEADEPPPLAAAAPTAKPKRLSANLQRAVALQQRADAAQRKQRAASRQFSQTREAAKRDAEAAAQRAKQTEDRAKALEARERTLLAEERLATTDPIGYMAKKGVKPETVAAFARGETNPGVIRAQQVEAATSSKIEALERKIAETEQAGKAQVKALQDSLIEQQIATARSNLLTVVAENADQFEAISLLLSPEEIIEKMEARAEKAAELHEDVDGDMLLERLEKATRKDPRWIKLQSKFERKQQNAPSTSQPNVPRRPTPNAPPTDKGEAAAAQRAPRPRPQTPDPADRTSPAEKHRQRVDRIARTTRIQGFGT